MGQGSRGGNSGLSSSGVRQRGDKEKLRQKENPRTVGKGGTGGTGGKGGRGGRRGFGGHNFPNLGIPHFGGPGTSGSSSAKKGPAAKKGKTTKPPAASKTAKIPSIKRVRGPKVKLTKQRTNKTPN